MVGWVITWERKGQEGGSESKIAAVLRYRPHKIVREIIEVLYANSRYAPEEFVQYFVKKKGKNNPYPARYAEVNGEPFMGRIYCGDDPYLYARLVDNLRVDEKKEDGPTITWKELPAPYQFNEMLRKAREAPEP